MTPTILPTMRELHSRSGSGLHVRLLWSELDNRLAVAVTDTSSGDEFAVEVPEGERPMDVFEHPFAYAAWRGIETHAPPPALPVPSSA